MKKVNRSGKISTKVIMLVAIILVATIGVSLFFIMKPTPEEKPPLKKELKLGVIMPGTTADPVWNMLVFRTLSDLDREWEWMKADFSEGLYSASEGERVAREYVAAGYDVVYFAGGQYIDATLRLAAEYPKVMFICGPWVPTKDLPPNVGSHMGWFYEVGFQLGVLAGLTTEKNTVGCILGMLAATLVEQVNAFHVGLKWIKPEAKFLKTNIGQTNDPTLAKEATLTHIEAGVDVIYSLCNLGVYGVNEACRERGVNKVIYLYQWPPIDESLYLSSSMLNLRGLLIQLLEAARAGKLGIAISGGVPEGITYVAPILHVPKKTVDFMKALEENIRAGKIKIPKVPTEPPLIENPEPYLKQMPTYQEYLKLTSP